MASTYSVNSNLEAVQEPLRMKDLPGNMIKTDLRGGQVSQTHLGLVNFPYNVQSQRDEVYNVWRQPFWPVYKTNTLRYSVC
jgi:hypothetical protein